MENWNDVTQGSSWRHRKTGRTCVVQTTARGLYDSVRLRHETGRITRKQVHYFLYDFEKEMGKKQITSVRASCTIYVEDLVDTLSMEEAEALIVELDRAQQDYEFTERLAKHFLAELSKEAEAAGEPLDLTALLPPSKKKVSTTK